jgi:hypothetical protein
MTPDPSMKFKKKTDCLLNESALNEHLFPFRLYLRITSISNFIRSSLLAIVGHKILIVDQIVVVVFFYPNPI